MTREQFKALVEMVDKLVKERIDRNTRMYDANWMKESDHRVRDIIWMAEKVLVDEGGVLREEEDAPYR